MGRAIPHPGGYRVALMALLAHGCLTEEEDAKEAKNGWYGRWEAMTRLVSSVGLAKLKSMLEAHLPVLLGVVLPVLFLPAFLASLDIIVTGLGRCVG